MTPSRNSCTRRTRSWAFVRERRRPTKDLPHTAGANLAYQIRKKPRIGAGSASTASVADGKAAEPLSFE